MDRLRIGIIGAGFGSYGLLPAFRLDDRCEVTAIAAASEDGARRAALGLNIPLVFESWEKLIASNEVDAIAIATPPVFQPAIALAALSRGRPVFTEKPIAANLKDAEKLVKAAGKAKVANVVDFLFPELHVFAKAKQLMDSGCIGRPLHIKAEWIFWSSDHRNNATTWRTDASAGGGALAHFGSHMIYYLQWFFGHIVSVTSAIKHFASRHSGETLTSLGLSFANGQTATLTISSGTPAPSRHLIEILGTTGSLILANTSSNPCGFTLTCHADSGYGVQVEDMESDVDCRVRPASQIVHRFIDWILTGQKTMPSFREGLDVQRVIEMARRPA